MAGRPRQTAAGRRAKSDNASSTGAIPPDFGAADGTPISNVATIMGDIDRALGVSSPPAVEFVFCDGVGVADGPWYKHAIASMFNFGHALVRYTLPSGEQVVMNIVNPNKACNAGATLINFLTPEEYFWGVRSELALQAEQCGVYNRGMIGVRVEEYPAHHVEAMHRHFVEMAEQERVGNAVYSLASAPITNLLARVLPTNCAEAGNCARWTSGGLVAAKLMLMRRNFPKGTAVHLFESQCLRDPSNVHVVRYRPPEHAVPRWPNYRPSVSGFIKPFHLLRSIAYWDLETIAEVIVEVPTDGIRAVVSANPRYNPRSKNVSYLWYYHHGLLVSLAAVATWHFSGSNAGRGLGWGVCAAVYLVGMLLYY